MSSVPARCSYKDITPTSLFALGRIFQFRALSFCLFENGQKMSLLDLQGVKNMVYPCVERECIVRAQVGSKCCGSLLASRQTLLCEGRKVPFGGSQVVSEPLLWILGQL